jgi:hypothetical protein
MLTHVVGLLLKEWLAHHIGCYLHNTQQIGETDIPSVGFRLMIPAIEQSQTYTLDFMSTGIGRNYLTE